MDTMRRKQVLLTKRQHQVVQQEADKLGITWSELLRRILDQWLERKEGRDG